MNRAPIAAIARREIAEIAADWRMVIPLLVLTVAVPLLAVIAVLMAAGYLHDPSWAISLLPLGLLLCGFLPAGFSLVNASESFVGEKERNTLESILATPVTDAEIYLGKLAGALLLPLCSSALAIVTFAGCFVLGAPASVVAQLHGWLLAAIVALVFLKALVLVTGAVLVSIHATSVRGANLLAAFILVPLGGAVNLEAFLIASHRPHLLLPIAALLAVVAALQIYAGFVTFHRETLLAPDPAAARLRRIVVTFRPIVAGIGRRVSSPGWQPRISPVRRFHER